MVEPTAQSELAPSSSGNIGDPGTAIAAPTSVTIPIGNVIIGGSYSSSGNVGGQIGLQLFPGIGVTAGATINLGTGNVNNLSLQGTVGYGLVTVGVALNDPCNTTVNFSGLYGLVNYSIPFPNTSAGSGCGIQVYPLGIQKLADLGYMGTGCLFAAIVAVVWKHTYVIDAQGNVNSIKGVGSLSEYIHYRLLGQSLAGALPPNYSFKLSDLESGGGNGSNQYFPSLGFDLAGFVAPGNSYTVKPDGSIDLSFIYGPGDYRYECALFSLDNHNYYRQNIPLNLANADSVISGVWHDIGSFELTRFEIIPGSPGTCPIPKPKLPIYPTPPQKTNTGTGNDLMGCCDDVMAQLAKLKKQVAEMHACLSPDDFKKSSGPARLIYPGATGDFEIQTYHDLFEYVIRQIDRAVGYLPMKVKIADSNPGVKGGKPVELQINSIADGLKLLIQDMVETEGDADILLNMAIRILYEAGITHQLAAVNNRYLENIEEHLDYKVKHVSADLPMAFTPHAGISGFKPGAQGNIDDLTKKATEEVLPELLKECLVKIKHTEYDDKKTQNERLLEILKHASVAAAALSIPTPGNPFELGDLLNAGVFAQSVRKFLDRENIKKATGVGDLDAFLSEVKSYYAKSAPDATQQDKPYGGDKSELPKINKPGKNKPGKKT